MNDIIVESLNPPLREQVSESAFLKSSHIFAADTNTLLENVEHRYKHQKNSHENILYDEDVEELENPLNSMRRVRSRSFNLFLKLKNQHSTQEAMCASVVIPDRPQMIPT